MFGDYRFGFLVFTDENTYGLDRSKLRAEGNGDALRIICDGFVWAGGQETAPGTARRNTSPQRRRRSSGTPTVEMDRPIKTVTTIVRGVPRGHVSFGGGGFTDPRDDESCSSAIRSAAAISTPGRAA